MRLERLGLVEEGQSKRGDFLRLLSPGMKRFEEIRFGLVARFGG